MTGDRASGPARGLAGSCVALLCAACGPATPTNPDSQPLRQAAFRTASAREIWYGEEARRRRKETVACDKLCLFTCLSQRTLADKAKMGMTLLTGNRGRAPA